MAEERVWMASYHLEDVAQLWYTQLVDDDGTPSWGRFKDLLSLRFGPPIRSAPLFELAECRRTGSVEEYSNRFQALLPRAGPLSEAQRVQLFTGGLLPPLSHTVRLHNPESLAGAISLARQVEAMELDKRFPRPRRPSRFRLPRLRPRGTHVRRCTAPPGRGAPNQARRLTTEEQAERRRLGLCYNCNEPYSRGHNRVCRRLFFIAGVELDEEPAGAEQDDVEAPVFSLHAMAGVTLYDTMQVRAFLGTAAVLALLDTGSTHNFIAEHAARCSGLPIQPRPRLTAKVANGAKVTCPESSATPEVTIHGTTFGVDLFVMPPAGFDLVLGHTVARYAGAHCVGRRRAHHAIPARGADHPLEGDQRQGRAGTLCDHGAPHTAPPEPLLAALLDSWADIFAEPRGLPPPRANDHRIVLKPGAMPVAVRPYRYPAAHKDELERQCAAMMAQGIVRRSDSAFSSPVLVKKPDGSWRFCVDYRALNELTVKDAFPIPVVDELLDELHGAQFFTKLDLRSGYHQVRMRPEDVHKTAFRTHDGLYEFLVMPFGLCNAPATFQALMNEVLRPFLRRFVLVFFDDILIYSPSWTEHLHHIRVVLEELRRHQLFLKRSKCAFGAASVAYLGHVISAAGVAMDPAKFVHTYGAVAAPLAALLKKDGFAWTEAATAAFAALKDAVTSAPVLALPDFSKLFVVECDASSHGFGAVLVREGHPIAFFGRPSPPASGVGGLRTGAHRPRPRRSALEAVPLGPPLRREDRSFRSQVHLDRRLATIPQHHRVGKLLGFDFTVEYKPGSSNVVANALSRRDTPEDGSIPALSAPRFDVLDRLRQAQLTDPAIGAIRDEVRAGTRRAPWSIVDNMLHYAGHLYVPPASPPLRELPTAVHEEGHEGVRRTLHRLRRRPGPRARVCDMSAQQVRAPTSRRPSPPLPVPRGIWTDVALDFIEALPRVRGKSVIPSVVDRFSKYCHFIPLAHPYSAESVAQAFFGEIVRPHGMPRSLVSDRDAVFTSKTHEADGHQVTHDVGLPPSVDGQSEAANKVIVMYLRCLTGDRPRRWLQWLPWAEYVFNTAYQSSLRDTPFRVVYGRDPPSIRSYEPGDTRVAAVARTMAEREEFLADVRHRPEQARAVRKKHYDKAHRDVAYRVGDWVLLRLRHRSPASMGPAGAGKLKPRYYGPYRVTELINDVAVRPALPARAHIHDVFHVGVLKKFHGAPPDTTPPPPPRSMARSPLNRSVLSSSASPAACAKCSSNGRISPLRRLPGKTSTPSPRSFRHSSSGTSCLSRRGEMSCGASRTPGAAARATCAAPQSALGARRPKPRKVAKDRR
ncbi:hypothetical protein U9M48_009508 [Paspalum notatum var. saurae]|uniref:Uncharacterized protein n=1 Tax=Paspalum notatum var. saurae TaxID=547442 RepID=A0AAQ3SRB4_PASNO